LPEWLIEQGIGEVRSALVEDDHIIEACITVEGDVPAGTIIAAKLIDIGQNGRNAIAVADGKEYLLPKTPPGICEGASFDLEVTRGKIPGPESWKRPLGRVADRASVGNQLNEWTVATPSEDQLGAAGWNDLIAEARSGVVRFAGGELRITPTPAMTLIDVDGCLAPEDLAVRGAAEAAQAIRRLDIGGSIGIDLPTTGSKLARQAAAAAIDERLAQPFERTAVNGFGFVQIVRPRARASLIELAQDRAPFEARALLRRAAFEPPGAKCLVAHPALTAVLEAHPDWLEALGRQLGGAIGLRADAALPMSGGYAEST
jgi:ribonuclease G